MLHIFQMPYQAAKYSCKAVVWHSHFSVFTSAMSTPIMVFLTSKRKPSTVGVSCPAKAPQSTINLVLVLEQSRDEGLEASDKTK
jgi:hypothetical protein